MEKLAELVKRSGVLAFALTDHDTFDGWSRAQTAAHQLGLKTISGIEISTSYHSQSLHILGYNCDPNDQKLSSALKTLKDARRQRIVVICEQLKRKGVYLEAEAVFALANNSVPGRPHVAQALVKKGLALCSCDIVK